MKTGKFNIIFLKEQPGAGKHASNTCSPRLHNPAVGRLHKWSFWAWERGGVCTILPPPSAHTADKCRHFLTRAWIKPRPKTKLLPAPKVQPGDKNKKKAQKSCVNLSSLQL